MTIDSRNMKTILRLIESNLPMGLFDFMKKKGLAPDDTAGRAAKHGDGFSPLNLAVIHDRPECIRSMMKLPCSLDAEDGNGWNPVANAAHQGREECLRVLLEGTCNLELENKTHGATPLILAIFQDHPECVKLLLEKGANPKTEHLGTSAIIRAIGAGSAQNCELLIAHGADGWSHDGSPMLAVVSDTLYPHLFTILLRACPDNTERLRQINLARMNTNDLYFGQVAILNGISHDTGNPLLAELDRLERSILMNMDIGETKPAPPAPL